MTEKDRKKAVQSYEKLCDEKTPGYWRSREDYLAYTSDYRLLAGHEPTGEQIEHCIRLLSDPLLLGLYEAFSQENFPMINDVLFQSACILHAKNIFETGVDHSSFFYELLPGLLAAALPDRV